MATLMLLTITTRFKSFVTIPALERFLARVVPLVDFKFATIGERFHAELTMETSLAGMARLVDQVHGTIAEFLSTMTATILLMLLFRVMYNTATHIRRFYPAVFDIDCLKYYRLLVLRRGKLISSITIFTTVMEEWMPYTKQKKHSTICQ